MDVCRQVQYTDRLASPGSEIGDGIVELPAVFFSAESGYGPSYLC